jgi:hypothetical protein
MRGARNQKEDGKCDEYGNGESDLVVGEIEDKCG